MYFFQPIKWLSHNKYDTYDLESKYHEMHVECDTMYISSRHIRDMQPTKAQISCKGISDSTSTCGLQTSSSCPLLIRPYFVLPVRNFSL